MGLFLLAVRWLLAGIFLRSGLAKATGLPAFRLAVGNYGLLPPALVTVVATALPFAEIAAAVFLAVGVLPVMASTALALLLVVFAGAIAVNLARGRVFDCGCAGSAVAPSRISWRHVAADLVLAVAAASIAVAPPSAAELWPGPRGPIHVATQSRGAFPVLLAVLICLTVMALLRQALTVRGLASEASIQLDARFGPAEPQRN